MNEKLIPSYHGKHWAERVTWKANLYVISLRPDICFLHSKLSIYDLTQHLLNLNFDVRTVQKIKYKIIHLKSAQKKKIAIQQGLIFKRNLRAHWDSWPVFKIIIFFLVLFYVLNHLSNTTGWRQQSISDQIIIWK